MTFTHWTRLGDWLRHRVGSIGTIKSESVTGLVEYFVTTDTEERKKPRTSSRKTEAKLNLQ